jgi:nitrate reductase gamma subunit
MTSSLLFGALPYTALAVLCLGLLARGLLTPAPAAAAEAAEAWAMFGGGKIWGRAFVAVAVLHLAGAIFPETVLRWNDVPLRLYLLEGSGFAIGLVALGWWAGAMQRYLRRTGVSAASEIADGALLAVLFVGIGSGLLTAVLYRWGSSWGAATLAPYGASLLHGDPLASFVEQMPRLVQLHVLSAFALMLVFPFTRAASAATFSVRWAAERAAAPFAGASGAAEGWLRRYDPAELIWPDESAWDEAAAEGPAAALASLAVPDERFGSVPPTSGIRDSGLRGTEEAEASQEADAEMKDTGSDAG